MKLKSFGCSFVWGTDLPDCTDTAPSSLSWPALIAQHHGWEYHCAARGGVGNLQILNRVLAELSEPDSPDSVFVISWTWQDRFDYVDQANEWSTLRPSLDSRHADYYFRHLHAEYRDQFASLSAVSTAVSLLTQHRQPFVMTTLDPSIFNGVDRRLHHPGTLYALQQHIEPHVKMFDGQDFLSWSRQQGFAESPLWHPLEQAHAAAADYVIANQWLVSNI